MAAANNEFFEALSMLEHERGITAEYLIEKIKAAIIIAVKKNYEVEEDHVKVDIDPAAGRFDVALIQDVVADEDWYDEHSEIGITEAQKIRKSYEAGDRIVTPLKTQPAAERDPVPCTRHRAGHRYPRGPGEGHRCSGSGQGRRGYPAPQRAGARRGVHRGPDPAGLRCGRGQH